MSVVDSAAASIRQRFAQIRDGSYYNQHVTIDRIQRNN